MIRRSFFICLLVLSNTAYAENQANPFHNAAEREPQKTEQATSFLTNASLLMGGSVYATHSPSVGLPSLSQLSGNVSVGVGYYWPARFVDGTWLCELEVNYHKISNSTVFQGVVYRGFEGYGMSLSSGLYFYNFRGVCERLDIGFTAAIAGDLDKYIDLRQYYVVPILKTSPILSIKVFNALDVRLSVPFSVGFRLSGRYYTIGIGLNVLFFPLGSNFHVEKNSHRS